MNVASTCSTDSYDISRREPSRRASNLKEPSAPKMKIRLCPLATVGGHSSTFRKKFRNESVSGCGFLDTKTRNHRKIAVQKLPKNAKKQLTENQKSTEYRNINKMETPFLHLSCQGSHPWTPVSHTTVLGLCCILYLYKNRITGIQSYKISWR